jgi:glycosyltransferase involved in cell wall biosynthesis
MRVLLVLGATTGGIGVHVRSLAERMAGDGYQAHIFELAASGPVVTSESSGLEGGRYQAPRCEMSRTGPVAASGSSGVQAGRYQASRFAETATRLAATVESLSGGVSRALRLRALAARADVVHAHGVRAGAITCVVLGSRRRREQRVVVTVHNAPLPDAGRVRRELSGVLERIIVRRADVVLGASEDLVARARRFGAREARFAPVVAPFGERTANTSDEIRAELGVRPGERIILAVGRLAPQKDYATLLTAAGNLSDTLVLIAGDGPLRSGLQTRIDAECLSVRLLGHRTDVPDLLAIADAFVMCSTWEARPLALQEAIRAGVPSVATAVGGIPDLVGDAAVLVPAGDPEALRAAVRHLGVGSRADLNSETTAEAMRERAACWPSAEDELEAVLAAYRGPK